MRLSGNQNWLGLLPVAVPAGLSSPSFHGPLVFSLRPLRDATTLSYSTSLPFIITLVQLKKLGNLITN